MNRRRCLQAAAVTLALPYLDARAAAKTPKPRRLLAICNNLGLLPDQFFPETAGRNYKPSPYLELLKDHREHFSVFSGVMHPDVDGGHPADI